MEIVTVNKQLTLEETGVTFHIDKNMMNTLRFGRQLDTNKEEYRKISALLYEITFNKAGIEENNTRQAVYVDDTSCISFIQMLLNRKKRTMIVTFRSLSTKKLISDLTFLCEIGYAYSMDEILVTVGSFHVELT